MKKTAALITAIGVLGIASSSSAQQQSCGTTFRAGHRIAKRTFVCGLNNPTVYVLVSGRQLQTYDQAPSHTSADWYGGGVVVRLQQRGTSYVVRAVSLTGRRSINVRLVSTQ